MRKTVIVGIVVGVMVAALAGAVLRVRRALPTASDLMIGARAEAVYSAVNITYPYDGALFPPESVAPRFAWSSPNAEVDTWLVHVAFDRGEPLQALVSTTEWKPDEPTWATLKARSTERPARVTVLGVAAASPRVLLARGSIALATSKDPVSAPIFYRDVILPFIEAVKDPSKLRWRFGTVDSRAQPKVVLENLPVCGNCHSFSADGRVLGMDVDYANDKGSYAVLETAREMTLSKRNIMSWSDFRRHDQQPTFGLLSQVSPDGRYVLSTVKDQSVFVSKPDLPFSQLFFPLKGILVYYDRQTGTFHALPGADDPDYVQSNPSWSPDGKYVVFARAQAYELATEDPHRALLSPEECKEFLTGGRLFRYDLYRVPWNDGKGGKAIPLAGASGNGRSNYFARFSPDGKWIVFCQAQSFMLLQPDSELFIIPAEGGEARRLACNGSRMNSWHSFSPNGRWLVFSSKANTAYTQLFLAHVDEQGECARPIVLDQFTTPDRAANIPEFVNLSPSAIAHIGQDFVDDLSYMRTALENIKLGDVHHAEELYRQALASNADSALAHSFLGGILSDQGLLQQANDHLIRAVQLDPRNGIAHYNLGNLRMREARYDEAIQSWKKAALLDPTNAGKAHNNMAMVLRDQGRLAEATDAMQAAVSADRNDAEFHLNFGDILLRAGRKEKAAQQWSLALRLARASGRTHIEREAQLRQSQQEP
jgi:Tol biopolymer transport system component/Tfp pilus assembly protein PilF